MCGGGGGGGEKVNLLQHQNNDVYDERLHSANTLLQCYDLVIHGLY